MFRQNLMKYYLQMKCATFSSMFGSANYDDLPNEGDSILFFVCLLSSSNSEMVVRTKNFPDSMKNKPFYSNKMNDMAKIFFLFMIPCHASFTNLLTFE